MESASPRLPLEAENSKAAIRSDPEQFSQLYNRRNPTEETQSLPLVGYQWQLEQVPLKPALF